MREFIEGLPAGAVVADVGCGNGKYFGVRRDIAVLGSDRSSGLAQVAAQRLVPGCAGGEPSPSPRPPGPASPRNLALYELPAEACWKGGNHTHVGHAVGSGSARSGDVSNRCRD